MPPQPNMNQMMKQVQKVQADIAKAQEALKDETVTAAVGGGVVSVEVTGDLEFKSLTIKPEAVDPDDPEMLSDMVLAAVNEGLRKAQEMASQRLEAAAGPLGGAGGMGGLGIPGL
ncbi:MAG: YbaB/EbfC family nucleoid-associated protein [Solirubrobacterales bacterium]|nr:YbaB/EbfC family nucleoid-associated protein [Solirubrobacterales bacterium]